MKSTHRFAEAALLVLLATLAHPVEGAAQAPKLLYARATSTERTLRDAPRKPTLRQLRSAVGQYEAIVRRYPGSGYSDNALWQGANLAFLAFDRYNDASDKRTGLRLLRQLIAAYPGSSLVVHAREVVRHREPSASSPPVPAPGAPPEAAPATNAPRAPAAAVVIREVRRTSLPDGMRVSIEMNAEAAYHTEQLENPRRVFFDIKGARTSAALQDSSLEFTDDIVREIRLGRHPHATRVVMDMEGAESYSVFTLYEPFRIVVDFKRGASAAGAPAPTPTPAPAAPAVAPTGTAIAPTPPDVEPLPSRPITASPPPALPSVNRDGKFSLARQLGLGIARIVIDAGHGGHDPGAKAYGLAEAEITLDIALRLSRLLQKQPGFDVVMTRSTDVFIPLEERTAIANREGADLFLSIHVNASRNSKARGVETYFLNFANNPEAEAIAARENAGSSQTMHRLPEIVKAIALNNKLDESRDFAEIVQRAMVRRLATRNKQLRDLGVKQAPFVVLIGAAMPSVLAEISFVTNKQEGSLLKTGAYRQHIAEALLDAVQRYQESLKKIRTASTAHSTTR